MKLKTLMISAVLGVSGMTAAVDDAAAQSSDGPVAKAGFVAGQHYRVLSPAQPTSSSADQVEVAEFFQYSCIHCYNFEPYVQAWEESKADYINFVRVPTVWNELAALHGQAFYTAQTLGKLDEMHQPFFREMHEGGNYMQSMDAVVDFFGRFDVDEATVRKTMESFSVHASVKRADELTRRYRVNATPTIVVNGKYVMTASDAGSYDRLMELIDALAAEENAGN